TSGQAGLKLLGLPASALAGVKKPGAQKAPGFFVRSGWAGWPTSLTAGVAAARCNAFLPLCGGRVVQAQEPAQQAGRGRGGFEVGGQRDGVQAFARIHGLIAYQVRAHELRAELRMKLR